MSRPGPKPLPLVDRFWRHVDATAGLFGCWLWTGATYPSGYGQFNAGTGSSPASRVALEIALGRQLTAGEQACHECDNPPCCRVGPGHIFLGDRATNMADMAAKGRSSPQRHPERYSIGESHPAARLSWEHVQAIRQRYAAGGIRQIDLGRRYGVAQQTVSGIVRSHSRLEA